MATTTSNFSWPIPQSTDLVKDGATAIASLGSGIDTSMADLKGGTTGQVLSKTSNTDMDFTWVTTDDANAIQNSIVDAKGDLISATANDTPARLAVGTNGQVLTADSTQSTGLKWADNTAGWTLLSTTTLSGASTSITSISQSYKNLRMVIYGVTNSTADGNMVIKVNGVSDTWYITFTESGTSTTRNNSNYTSAATVTRTDSNNIWDITFTNYSGTSANFKSLAGSIVFVGTGSAVKSGTINGAIYSAGAGLSQFNISNTGGNLAGGTVLIYGGN